MDFVDAPPVQKRRILSQKWVDVVDTLRNAPVCKDKDSENYGFRAWGNVGSYSPGTATGIRRGKYAAFLDGMPDDEDPELWMTQNWEITTRKVDGGARNDIYIRYLG